MADKKVSIDELEGAISEILTGYADELSAGIKTDAQEVAKQAVSALKSSSPVGSGSKKGHYYSGWKATVESEGPDSINVVVHNSKKPGLVHLLENGHSLVYFGRRTGKFVGGRVHVAPVEQEAIDEFEKRVEARISS